MKRFTSPAVACWLVYFLISTTGCVTPKATCITPPLTHSESDRKAAIEISGKLEKIPISGTLKLDFEKTLKSDFDKLSDTNAALLLFLNAIDCYLQRGKVGHEIAKEMAAIVRSKYAAAAGLQGTDAVLTPIERSLIQKSTEADKILGRLRQFGIQ